MSSSEDLRNQFNSFNSSSSGNIQIPTIQTPHIQTSAFNTSRPSTSSPSISIPQISLPTISPIGAQPQIQQHAGNISIPSPPATSFPQVNIPKITPIATTPPPQHAGNIPQPVMQAPAMPNLQQFQTVSGPGPHFGLTQIPPPRSPSFTSTTPPQSSGSLPKNDEDDDLFGDHIKPDFKNPAENRPAMPGVAFAKPVFNTPGALNTSGPGAFNTMSRTESGHFKSTRRLLSSSTTAIKSLSSSSQNATPLEIDLPIGPGNVGNENTDESAELPDEIIPDFRIPLINAAFPNDKIIKVTSTITEALNRAVDGSKIMIPTGTYRENIIVTKRVAFIAENNDAYLISDAKTDTVTIKASGVVFSGMSIQQNESQAAGAIKIEEGSALFDKCSFIATYMPTIMCKGTALVGFTNCCISARDSTPLNISQNVQAYFEGTQITQSKSSGCIIRGDCKVKFTNCSFSKHEKSGIVVSDNVQLHVENSTFSELNFAGIELSSHNLYVVLKKNTFTGCKRAGVVSFVVATPRIFDCTFNNNYNGLEISDGSAVHSKNNTFNGSENASLVCFNHTTLWSQNDSFTGPGNAIIVSGRADATFEKTKIENITGYGLIIAGEENKTWIEEFTATNVAQSAIFVTNSGTMRIERSKITNSSAAGIQIVNGGKDITIKSCEIKQNQKAGIEIQATKETVKIDRTNISDNQQCGLLVSSSNYYVSSCTINGNAINGIDATESEGNIADSTIEQNQKNAILQKGGTLKALNLQSNNNETAYCINSTNHAVTTVSKSTFSNNCVSFSSSKGAELTLIDSTVTNCQIALLSHQQGKIIAKNGIFTQNKRTLVAGSNENNASISEINVSVSKFDSNDTHIETYDNGKITCTGSDFAKSKSGLGINCDGGELILESCVIVGEKEAGVAAKGKLILTGSRIEGCGKCGVYLCGQNSDDKNLMSQIKENTLRDNGAIGIQVMSGNPIIEGNTISGNSCYGIHIEYLSSPSVCNNSFKDNASGNVNRE